MLRTLLLTVLLGLAACGGNDPLRVQLAQGEAEGAMQDGVRVFRSLPYAAAPQGALRFRAPRPALAWEGVRDATQPGPLCMQNTAGAAWGPWTGALAPSGPVSEDCLTLSIWTPAHSSNEALPVMFWIPGGGLTDGGEAMSVYNGLALAQRGIIVVTINYRLNAFGLLTHPALEEESDGARGNYALRDVIAALRWVNENIVEFGGDPEQVTIAGQSAGGALAYALLDAPQVSGLFSRAILQSFPPGSHMVPSRADAEAAGLRLAAYAAGADLRALPAAEILAWRDGLDLHVDGVTVTDAGLAAPPYRNDVPILAGITADELSFLRPGLAHYSRALERHGPGYGALYPADDDASAANAFLRADRERTLAGLERWARATQGGAPLYLYLWTHTPPGPDAEVYRAFHSSEVMYMFGALNLVPERSFTARDHAISDRMLEYWSNFIKWGDPNGVQSRAWPRADIQTPVVMEVGGAFEPLEATSERVRSFWNAQFDAGGDYRFQN